MSKNITFTVAGNTPASRHWPQITVITSELFSRLALCLKIALGSNRTSGVFGGQMGNRRFATAKRWTAVLLVVGMGLAGNTSATLMVETDGVVLDTNTGLEWEQNANHGLFDWAGAVNYATTLALDGGGWHLALIGELQGLYDDLLAAGVCTIFTCIGDIGGFTGIGGGQSFLYWSGTELGDPNFARDFGFGSGSDFIGDKPLPLLAWAVRPHDRDIIAAPEPATLGLLGVALAGLGFSRRKQ